MSRGFGTVAYCKLCEIIQIEPRVRIDHPEIVLCQGCYQSILDYFYDAMCDHFKREDTPHGKD